MPSLSNVLPTKQITKALSAALRAIGLELTDGAAAINDPDRRRALKSAQRVATHLETLSKALSDFEVDFDRAEAKTPRKQIMARIENAISNCDKDPSELLSRIESELHKEFGDKIPTKPAPKSRRKPAGAMKQYSASISIAPDDIGKPAEVGAMAATPGISMAATTMRTPRRRQKRIDPLIEEARRRSSKT